MASDLSRMLRPRSVAVLGGGWAANVIEQLLRAGFEGDLWPVHPGKAEVHGVPAFSGLSELPDVPDATWIGVNRDATVEAVAALSAMGAGGAVCFASGFRETADGAARESALLAAAAEMPIIGPNCYGFLNYLDGATLWPDQHGGERVERGVAIITQSSNIAINLTMQRRGLPIAYMMTAGNQAQRGIASLADGFLDDPRVTAIGLHIEGIGDLGAFAAMTARARAQGVPVVVLPVGKSEQARAAAISHTASLAGGEAAARAFFSRLGVPTLDSLPAFAETLKLLHLFGPLPGSDMLSVSCSGGEASLMADSASQGSLCFRPYAEAERAAVAETLNSFVSVANPLDYHTFIWGDEAAMTRTFTAAMAPGFDLSAFVLDFPRTDRCSDASWEPAVNAIAAAARASAGRAVAVSVLPENIDETRCSELMARGIAPLCGIAEALTAAESAARIGAAWAAAPPGAPLPARVVAGESVLLDEAESKSRLAGFGLRVPEGRIVHTAEDARAGADELGVCAQALVIKALGIAHKSDADAVQLNLRTADAVADKARLLLRAHDRAMLLERMVEGGLVELLIGISRDPAYGLMLTIGAGGVLTEIMADSATLALPATEDQIVTTLASLRVARLLDGYRGKPPADRQAAVAAILAVARFAEAHCETLEELDVNPLIVCRDGAYAADALIRMRIP